MANRRMFAKTIIDSDAFLEMPSSSQMLYFHLSMRADDDGFVNNPKRIMRMIGAGEDDLKLLFVKRFLIWFESGVVVIKHWKIHNYIQKDRYTKTMYQEEFSRLDTKGNKAYTELTETSNQAISSKCTQDGYKMDTQVRLGKGRLEYTEQKSDETERKEPVRKSDRKEIDAFFESIWKAYPEKKGKSQVSLTTRRKLQKVGEETLLRAIRNYEDDLRINDWKKPMHGSTFFNGRYEDYLQVEEKPKVQFLNIGDDDDAL